MRFWLVSLLPILSDIFEREGLKRVAVIGAGIVVSTAAYYLSKSPDVEVTVFDDGKGQATKAAAGIISPWFKACRNKAWTGWRVWALIFIRT